MLLLGRERALERVAALLLEMDERLTVSRTLSILRDEQLLVFDGPTQRRIELLDRKGLGQFEP